MASRKGISIYIHQKGHMENLNILLGPGPKHKVYQLLEHVQIAGSVLDACGSRTDAVSHILSERGYLVTTNDVNRT